MLPVARIGDSFSDGDTQAQGSGDVFANNIPVARLGDSTTGHGCFPPVPVTSGSSTVFANNLPFARVTDSHAAHCCPNQGCHGGVFVAGSGDVFAG